MKVILVTVHVRPSPQAVPLAAAYLKAALTADEGLSRQVQAELAEYFLDASPAACAAEIAAGKPDAVGFSAYVWNREFVAETIRELRRLSPQAVIFAGGPEATSDPESLLRAARPDFLIIGEGEVSFTEAMGRLASGEAIAGLPGTATLVNDELTFLPRRPVEILDTLPSPLLTRVLEAKPDMGMLWQLSRGCDYACAFCLDTGGMKGTRRFSLDRIEGELKLLVKSRVSQIFALDSTFNRDPELARRILKMVRRHAPHIHFHFEVRAENLDREMARLFASLTCSVQVGLQSADTKVLKLVHRSIDRDAFVDKIALLNEEGVIFGFDVIWGLPGDSFEGFRESVDFALQLWPNHLDSFPLAVLPGTPLAAKAGGLELCHLPEPPYTVTGSPTFPPEGLARAARLGAACDIFYNRGRSVAWFLPVVRGLGMKPTEFLEEFAAWLEEKSVPLREEELSDDDIFRLQCGFLEAIFASRKKKRLLPVALDLAEYHRRYAEALMATPPELPTDRELERRDLLAEAALVAPSARLSRFRYDIIDILEAGEIDLEEFASCFRPAGSCAVIYPCGGEVRTESLAEQFCTLLDGLDGRTPAGEAAGRAGLSPEEAREFLDFAWSEGIVTR
jgi:hypothetical protein